MFGFKTKSSENKNERAKRLVAKYTRGSVTLQRKSYVTASEKATRKAKVLQYDFS